MPFNSTITKLLNEAARVNDAAFDKNLAALKALIADPTAEDQLRFIIFSSGGLGHQSTAANIIYRMVALGLKGMFEVIYFDNDIAKIAILFPQFDPNDPSEPVVMGDASFIFVSESRFRGAVQPIYKIGITGGADGVEDNIAEYFYVQYLLILQPYQWKLAPSLIQTASKIPKLNTSLDSSDALSPLSFAKRGYYIADPVMDATNINFFKASEYADKYPIYNQITTSLLAKKTNMMPVYGIDSLSFQSINTATVLFNLTAAVAMAQDKTDKVGGQVKGTVMVIISTLSAEIYNDFTTLVDGTNENLENNPLKGWIVKNKLPARIKTYNYNDAALPDAITALEGKPNNIVVVKMGSLPLYAFNYLYYIADIPPVFEGAATNSLILNFDKDYLALTSQLNDSFTLYPTLPLNAVNAGENAEAMKEVSKIIGSTLLDWKRDLEDGSYDVPSEILAFAILIAFEAPDTSAQIYFRSLRAFFHNQREDKMLMGVFYLLQYLKNK
ncbi:hypothetical protein [Flavobacterium sp. T12S277]|uniref:hypothetical protein n=1 Tax=Flavobacterium sp. T12S277 TaxID=3402752 RepID=UPI003AEEA0C7